jgi:predicted dehydrogenase
MKILVAGLGSIGQRHIRNLRSLLGSELEISAYRVRGLPEVLSESFEIEKESNVEKKYDLRSYYNLDEALAQRPDALFICNPSSHHLELALAGARAGCHLFVEKPLSHSYDEVEELVDLVQSKNLVAMVGYQMRFHPCLIRLHRLLQEERVGRVVTVRVEVGEYLPGSHPYEDYRQRYASRSDLGGGVVISQSHELDYIYWLFGLPTRVFAMGGRRLDFDIDVEDIASSLLECEVAGRTITVRLHQDYIQRPARRTCEAIGESGRIEVDLQKATVKVFDSDGNEAEQVVFENFQRNQLFVDELKHFLACLAGKEEPKVSLRDGAGSLRMALAIKKSLESSTVVNI